MTQTTRLFRLNDDLAGLGLSCDETGLALAGVPLLRKSAEGFVPRAREEIDALLRHANTGRAEPVALSPSGLASVAEALNRRDLAKARMTAVFMRVPDLDADSAVRLILADDALAKYNADETRDDLGQWATQGGGGTSAEQAQSSAEAPGAPPVLRPRIWPSEPETEAAAPTPTAPAGPNVPATPARGQSSSFRPGGLSAHYESNGKPGAVSTGKGDPGGISYGAYQIKKDNVSAFVAHEGAKWPELQGKTPGSAAFATAWKAVAAKDPAGFEAAQYAYIARTHYQPQLAFVQQATGVDVSTRSHALQDVVWSTAVQVGPQNHIVSGAIQTVEAKGSEPTDAGFDAAVINAVYDERGRARPDGALVHFRSSSPMHQQNIAARFQSERRRALADLASEGR